MRIHTLGRLRLRIAVAALGLVLAVVSSTAAQTMQSEPLWPKLTPRLQELLQREMVAILDATHHILEALVMGDDATVGAQARAISASFIMDRAMTDKDRADLRAALPAAFIELDRGFHRTAEALAAAAASGNRAREHALFADMLKTCSTCHSRFAADRFPAFAR